MFWSITDTTRKCWYIVSVLVCMTGKGYVVLPLLAILLPENSVTAKS